MTVRPLRVGVDVGGTFTKAVAVVPHPLALRAHAVVPTTHHARRRRDRRRRRGARALFAELGDDARAVELVAFSTTQAMNALLEGDVARVGVVGIGAAARPAPRAQAHRVGDVALAPGARCAPSTRSSTRLLGLSDAASTPRSTVSQRAAAGARGQRRVRRRRAGGRAARSPSARASAACRSCAGHELTGAYGLEPRTVSAAINASILPLVERTARIVEGVLHEAGIDVPLLVLRGDGGAMCARRVPPRARRSRSARARRPASRPPCISSR